jgi:hypothetical protein
MPPFLSVTLTMTAPFAFLDRAAEIADASVPNVPSVVQDS